MLKGECGHNKLAWALSPTRELSYGEQTAIERLAQCASGPDFDVGYVTRRYARYAWVLRAWDTRGLAAFKLVEGFSVETARYFYLGPTFSRDGVYLPLFVAWLSVLLEQHAAENVYLAAELQNPRLLEVLRTLFPSCCYPKSGAAGVPSAVSGVASTFERQLSHVQGLNPVTLRTTSSETLFCHRLTSVDGVEESARRGVNFRDNDCQMAVVMLPCSPLARKRAQNDLQAALCRLERA